MVPVIIDSLLFFSYYPTVYILVLGAQYNPSKKSQIKTHTNVHKQIRGLDMMDCGVVNVCTRTCPYKEYEQNETQLFSIHPKESIIV